MVVYGVAFHQSPVADGKRTITYRCPQSVYGPLVGTVRAQWPD